MAQKLAERMKRIEDKLDDLSDTLKISTTDIHRLVVEIAANQNAAPKNRGGSRASSKATTSSAAKGATYPSNSMIWWKNRFEGEEEYILKTYCNDTMVKSLENFLKTDEKVMSKKGSALAKAKGTYLWTNFIKDNKTLKARIKSDYEQAKEEWQKSKKTPVSKEESTPPGSPTTK